MDNQNTVPSNDQSNIEFPIIDEEKTHNILLNINNDIINKKIQTEEESLEKWDGQSQISSHLDPVYLLTKRILSLESNCVKDHQRINALFEDQKDYDNIVENYHELNNQSISIKNDIEDLKRFQKKLYYGACFIVCYGIFYNIPIWVKFIM